MAQRDSSNNPSDPPKPKTAAGAKPYVFSEQVGHLLRRAYQTHLAIFQQSVSTDPQLTAVQFVTLCALRDGGPSSQVELVRATAIDQATIRGIIDRLKSRGLVEPCPEVTDRRKAIVMLTPSGAALLDEVVPMAQDVTERTFAGLNSAERVALLFLLRKIGNVDEGS